MAIFFLSSHDLGTIKLDVTSSVEAVRRVNDSGFATVWSSPVTVWFNQFRQYVDDRTELNRNFSVGFWSDHGLKTNMESGV